MRSHSCPLSPFTYLARAAFSHSARFSAKLSRRRDTLPPPPPPPPPPPLPPTIPTLSLLYHHRHPPCRYLRLFDVYQHWQRDSLHIYDVSPPPDPSLLSFQFSPVGHRCFSFLRISYASFSSSPSSFTQLFHLPTREAQTTSTLSRRHTLYSARADLFYLYPLSLANLPVRFLSWECALQSKVHSHEYSLTLQHLISLSLSLSFSTTLCTLFFLFFIASLCSRINGPNFRQSGETIVLSTDSETRRRASLIRACTFYTNAWKSFCNFFDYKWVGTLSNVFGRHNFLNSYSVAIS